MEEKILGAAEELAEETAGTQGAGRTFDLEGVLQKAAEKAAQAAEKKHEAVFKSILKQNGVDGVQDAEKLFEDFLAAERNARSRQSEKDEIIAAMKADFDSQRNGWEREKKEAAAEQALKDMGVDPEFLPLIMADVLQKADGIELAGRQVKNPEVLQEYRERYPRAFVAKSVPPKVTAEIAGEAAAHGRRKISGGEPYFF